MCVRRTVADAAAARDVVIEGMTDSAGEAGRFGWPRQTSSACILPLFISPLLLPPLPPPVERRRLAPARLPPEGDAAAHDQSMAAGVVGVGGAGGPGVRDAGSGDGASLPSNQAASLSSGGASGFSSDAAHSGSSELFLRSLSTLEDSFVGIGGKSSSVLVVLPLPRRRRRSGAGVGWRVGERAGPEELTRS
jgi:hypothetical protein